MRAELCVECKCGLALVVQDVKALVTGMTNHAALRVVCHTILTYM